MLMLRVASSYCVLYIAALLTNGCRPLNHTPSPPATHPATLRATIDGHHLAATLSPNLLKVDNEPYEEVKIDELGPRSGVFPFALPFATKNYYWYVVAGGYVFARKKTDEGGVWERASTIGGPVVASLSGHLATIQSLSIVCQSTLSGKYATVAMFRDEDKQSSLTEALAHPSLFGNDILGVSKMGDIVLYDVRTFQRKQLVQASVLKRHGLLSARPIFRRGNEILFFADDVIVFSAATGAIEARLPGSESCMWVRPRQLGASLDECWFLCAGMGPRLYRWDGGNAFVRAIIPLERVRGSLMLDWSEDQGVLVEVNPDHLSIVPLLERGADIVPGDPEIVRMQPSFGPNSVAQGDGKVMVATRDGKILRIAVGRR